MKKSLIAGILLSAVMLTGCSVDEVVSQADKDKLLQQAEGLKNQAQQQLDSLVNDTQLQEQLAAVSNLTPEKVEQWLNDLAKDQVIQQANQQLGEDVVQQVIQEVTENNRGVLDAAAIVLIKQELEKRMGQ